MSTPNTSQTSTTVRVVAPIESDVLCRLLMEYSKRLKEYSERLNQKFKDTISSKQPGLFTPKRDVFNDLEQLEQDVQYLISQTQKLIDKASVYHEHTNIDEGKRFELELGLFDAEGALRSAKRVLKLQNPSANVFTHDGSKL